MRPSPTPPDAETASTEPSAWDGYYSIIEQPDDAWQQFKEDVAMGYIDRDGNQLEPPEPDWAEAEGSR